MDEATYAGQIVEMEDLCEVTSEAEAYLASPPTEFAPDDVL